MILIWKTGYCKSLFVSSSFSCFSFYCKNYHLWIDKPHPYDSTKQDKLANTDVRWNERPLQSVQKITCNMQTYRRHDDVKLSPHLPKILFILFGNLCHNPTIVIILLIPNVYTCTSLGSIELSLVWFYFDMKKFSVGKCFWMDRYKLYVINMQMW